MAGMVELEDAAVVRDGATLLSPVSLTVGAGEALAVQGRNGSGKSTMLELVAGLRKPSAGVVRVGGRPVQERDPGFRTRVAAMLGLPPMAADLTVLDHLQMVAVTWYEARSEAARYVEAILEELELTALRTRYPHELSSGQLHAVALALVLVRPFQVLLLDEPEQRLDDSRVALLAEALRTRREAGRTVLFATHSTALAEGLASRTLRLGATS